MAGPDELPQMPKLPKLLPSILAITNFRNIGTYSDPHSNASEGAQLLPLTEACVVPMVLPFTNGVSVAQNSPCGFALVCESWIS
jgi:hypothetical protein